MGCKKKNNATQQSQQQHVGLRVRIIRAGYHTFSAVEASTRCAAFGGRAAAAAAAFAFGASFTAFLVGRFGSGAVTVGQTKQSKREIVIGAAPSRHQQLTFCLGRLLCGRLRNLRLLLLRLLNRFVSVVVIDTNT